MPLLVEQERLVAQEANLINVPGSYNWFTVGWGTLHDYGNVTLPADGILLIKFDTSLNGSAGAVRIKVGSNYVYGLIPSGGWTTYGLAVWLSAGTYDVLVEGYVGSAAYTVSIQNFQAGLTAFNDQQGAAVQTYSSGIPLTVTNRATPVGVLSNTTYLLQCFASTSSAVTNFENIGDNLTNGVSVSIDGRQVSWDERNQDTGGYGAASAKAAISLPVGAAHTATISKRNGSTVVIISVITCPWILPNVVHMPVNLSFSQGSTVYCILEPLFLNLTKFVGVGVIRGITYGAADDYYSSLSGVDLIHFSFTMDIEDILNNKLIMYGLGGCIGIIGVDAR